MSDMAAATSEAASMASTYGVEIDQLSALTATAVSKTRKSGSEIGNALSSIFVNLSDVTNSTITKAFGTAGVSMTKMVDGSKKLKDPIELLEELSTALNSFEEGDVRRSTILNDIGGKYHANTLSAILTGWEDYEKILQDYAEGTGSAEKEAEKSANNWQAQLNKINNSWTELINTFVKSDSATGFLSFANTVIGAFADMTDGVGAFVTAITALGAIQGARGKGRDRMTSLFIICPCRHWW